MLGFLFGLELLVAFFETLDSAGGIDQLVFAGEIRVTVRADIDRIAFRGRRECLDLVPAGTGDRDLVIGWMNSFFHSALAFSIAYFAKQDKI